MQEPMNWIKPTDIQTSSLSDEQLEARKHFIGASDAVRIMSGQWHELWLEKKGLAEPIEPTLPMLLGIALEPFHRQLIASELDTRIGEYGEEYEVRNYKTSFDTPLAYTPDGVVHNGPELLPIEMKAVSGSQTFEQVLNRYYAQLQQAMWVSDTPRILFSVIFLNHSRQSEWIYRNNKYIDEYLGLAADFWKLVIDDVEPPENNRPIEKKHYTLDKMKTRYVSTSQFNTWSGRYTFLKPSVDEFNKIKKDLKEMMDEETRTIFNEHIYVNRAKNGNITIREITEKKYEELKEKTKEICISHDESENE